MEGFLYYKFGPSQPESLELWHVVVFIDYYITGSHKHKAHATYVHVGQMQETTCKRVVYAPYPYMEQFLSNEFVASLILFKKALHAILGFFIYFGENR